MVSSRSLCKQSQTSENQASKAPYLLRMETYWYQKIQVKMSAYTCPLSGLEVKKISRVGKGIPDLYVVFGVFVQN